MDEDSIGEFGEYNIGEYLDGENVKIIHDGNFVLLLLKYKFIWLSKKW